MVRADHQRTGADVAVLGALARPGTGAQTTASPDPLQEGGGREGHDEPP